MKKVAYTIILIAAFLVNACNKEKSYLKKLTDTWDIELSEFSYQATGDVDSLYESVKNAGKLIVYDEDPDNPSKESKLYDFYCLDANSDTIISKFGGTLITDEKNKRMIMTKSLGDSSYLSDIVWNIELDNRKKQTWTTYGVDSMLFYPSNNQNPGAAKNWIEWRIKLKK